MRCPDQQRDRGRGRQPEDQPRSLTARPKAEPQHGLERRCDDVGLALGQRLGGSRFGASGLDRDGEPFLSEIALGLGNPDREIFG